MQFRAEQYYQASLERMNQAWTLYRAGNAFSLSIYCGGLAVECLLRAFRWTEDTSFEGRHDLADLLRASRLLGIDEDRLRRQGQPELVIRESGSRIAAAMDEIIVLWHNNLRFASEASLKAHLVQVGRVRGVRGDPRKKAARDLIDAAQFLIDRGTLLWKSRKKS